MAIDDLALRRPTLDDVFLTLTGHAAEEDEAEDDRCSRDAALATRSSSRERNLLRIPRQPELLIGFTIQPIMFVLLFVYVFGGAIQTPGYDYVDFLIPGILVQNIAFGGRDRVGLAEDLQQGPDRPLPLAADGALGRARRPHAGRRRGRTPSSSR